MVFSIRALLLCVLFTVVGCNDKFESLTSPPAERVPLLGSLKSFDSPDETSAKLDPKLLPWKTVEEPQLVSRSDKRPRFEFLRVRVEGYLHLGQLCDLELVFFNDRLMEVRLLAKDTKVFLAALRDKARIDLVSNKEVRVGMHVPARTWTNDRGETWVDFEDNRLWQEMSDWISRFA